ncbi:uncharacterized protein [Blastocystis hominis]|uniref:Protein-S-isoprenylcysteine O-methyltransferase n=1 Tax=Blastocystis hominis TaxID=12968 RepID=D8LX91_BLAHO|nr:uncharacterized protein [Blastocystis hominis]CBK20886.2 unnamed protein product [Blastocystis hominis]|eukprot:XP_012894934.1 uncharacterized protein [Blastocystis hominis]
MEETNKRFSSKERAKIISCGIILGLLLIFFLVSALLQLFGVHIIWRINWSWYVVFVTAFHLSEFFITAVYRKDELKFDSYLVNQSPEYEIAMITGMAEYWIEYFFLPVLRYHWITFWLGFTLCLGGGLLRAFAEIQMQGNFNHHIQTTKQASHQLVTTGLYSFFRHPAYTGWFYFSIGTQILLNNPVCTVLYAGASWYFFYDRIPYEERLLLDFFPEYESYRERTHVLIPFIPKVKKPLLSSRV